MLKMKAFLSIFLFSLSVQVHCSLDMEVDGQKFEKLIIKKLSSKKISPNGWDLGPYQWGPDLTYISEFIWRSRLQEVRLGNKDYIFEEFFLGIRLGGFYYLGLGNFVVKKFKIIYEKKNRKNRFGHLIPLIFKRKEPKFKLHHFSLSLETGNEALIRFSKPLPDLFTDISLLLFRNYEKRLSFHYDLINEDAYRKTVTTGKKIKQGLELFSGVWITRMRHLKYNTTKGKNKVQQNLVDNNIFQNEYFQLSKLTNFTPIKRLALNLNENILTYTEKYKKSFKRLSFFKVVNKQWQSATVKRKNKYIQIKAEKSNWFLPSFSESHKRIIRLNKDERKKTYLLKIKLKDSRVTKREYRKYYSKMLQSFPMLQRLIRKNLQMDVTVYAKTSKWMSTKILKNKYKRKRHYYKLDEIKKLTSTMQENDYFIEIKLVSDGKKAIFHKGKLVPPLTIYSDTELILSY